MRCIDADKLYPDCLTKNGTLAISQSQIANAPTVPQDCSECKRFDFPYVTINVEFTEEEKQEIIEKVRKNLLARPQGEWVENLMHTTICSNCGGIRRDNRVDYIAFCNKCGADMR